MTPHTDRQTERGPPSLTRHLEFDDKLTPTRHPIQSSQPTKSRQQRPYQTFLRGKIKL